MPELVQSLLSHGCRQRTPYVASDIGMSIPYDSIRRRDSTPTQPARLLGCGNNGRKTAATSLSSLTTGACWSNAFAAKLSSQELIAKLSCLYPPSSRLKGIIREGPPWHVLQHELATPPTVCTGGTPQTYRWDALMDAYHWTATYSPTKPAYYARLRECKRTLDGGHSSH